MLRVVQAAALALLPAAPVVAPSVARAVPGVAQSDGARVAQMEPVPPEGRFWHEAPPREMPEEHSLAPLVEKLSPAVVNVLTTDRSGGDDQGNSDLEEMLRKFLEPGGPGQSGPRGGQLGPQRRSQPRSTEPHAGPRRRGIGSGFILSRDGYVVTNDHLVRGAEEIKVKLLDEREFKAKVVGRDPKLDLALLKMEGARDLPTLTLGDSDRLRVGDGVIAIGNPFGLGHTVTQGIVSAKARVIGAGPYDDFIQTDASINPGNSGGPLLNRLGEVIGINTAISAQGQGIGFAIPINLAKSVLYQLREKGRVVRGYLGVNIQHVTADLARSFGLKTAHGALVSEVQPNTPAARAGLSPGDIILSLDGQPITRAEQLPMRVASMPPGRQIALDVVRKNGKQRINLTLSEMKNDQEAVGRPQGSHRGLGLQLRRNEGGEAGLVVESVDPQGPAGGLLEEGDVLLQVGGRRVHLPSDVTEANRALMRGESVPLLVEREGQKAWVSISPRASEK
jgi:serine protease Do